MKYYWRESLGGYRRMRRQGKSTWGAVNRGPDDDTDVCTRAFLEEVLPRLILRDSRPAALEIGCGTGLDACLLAEIGLRVHAIDLCPIAIEVAEEIAAERRLDIHYEAVDATQLPHEGEKYDLIVDTYCLQNIVLDDDRKRVFAAVRARLKQSGYYLICCCGYKASRHHPEDRVVDSGTGRVLHRWDRRQLFDPETAVCYELFSDFRYGDEMNDAPEDYEGSVEINGEWYLPTRRYHRPEAFRKELQAAGFEVLLQQGEEGGHVVCALAGSSVRLSEV